MIQTVNKVEWPHELQRTNIRRIAHRKESWGAAVEATRIILEKLGVKNGFIQADTSGIVVCDPAVVLQFHHHGQTMIYAFDQFIRPEHNLMAIVDVLHAEYIKAKYNMILIIQKN